MSEISPTARALRALEILQNRPGCTADDLAQRLGVTDRAARRYVAILREAGIPVESVRGPYGGYRLGRGAATAAPRVQRRRGARPGDGGPRRPARRRRQRRPRRFGLGKIIRALPDQRGAAGRDHARARPRRTRQVGAARPGHHERAGRGGGRQRQVRIGYRSAAGHSHTFEVDPWSVVVRYGRWYLLCFAHHADARADLSDRPGDRSARARRTFETPADLDPAAVLEENLGTGWEYDTRVVFHAPASEVAPWLRPTMGGPERAGRRSVRRSGSTSNPPMYAGEWLAGVPFPFTVEGGEELRAAMAEVAVSGLCARGAGCALDPIGPTATSLASGQPSADGEVVAAPERARVVPGRASVVAQHAHLDVAARDDLGAERRLRRDPPPALATRDVGVTTAQPARAEPDHARERDTVEPRDRTEHPVLLGAADLRLSWRRQASWSYSICQRRPRRAGRGAGRRGGAHRSTRPAASCRARRGRSAAAGRRPPPPSRHG